MRKAEFRRQGPGGRPRVELRANFSAPLPPTSSCSADCFPLAPRSPTLCWCARCPVHQFGPRLRLFHPTLSSRHHSVQVCRPTFGRYVHYPRCSCSEFWIKPSTSTTMLRILPRLKKPPSQMNRLFQCYGNHQPVNPALYLNVNKKSLKRASGTPNSVCRIDRRKPNFRIRKDRKGRRLRRT
jgi:hypothetical protein